MCSGGETFYIGVYVDDIILAGSTEEKIQEVKDKLNQMFDVKDLGKLHYFLGLTISQSDNDIWLGQPTIPDIFCRNMECRTASLLVHQ